MNINYDNMDEFSDLLQSVDLLKLSLGSKWWILKLATRRHIDSTPKMKSEEFHFLSSSVPGFGYSLYNNYELEFSFKDSDVGVTIIGNLFVCFNRIDLGAGPTELVIRTQAYLPDPGWQSMGKFFMTEIPKRDLPLYIENTRPRFDQILKGL